jgi:sialate O-acetylesterase
MTLLTDQPLATRDGKEPALLEMAGADGRYVPARAMIEGPYLHLTAAGVAHPVRARYAWTDYGIVNLFAANGQPLEPFEI